MRQHSRRDWISAIVYCLFILLFFVGLITYYYKTRKDNTADCPAGYITIVDYKGFGCVVGFRP